jgi:hypothetical protein
VSSDYRLNLIWTSHGAQLRADIERNIGGLVGFDRQVRSHTRNLGLWGQQMRAVGTTIRYALAGATVYATASAVSGLGQFLDRLGEIDALAGEIDSNGKLTSLGRGLNQVGDIAIDLSNRFGIAVDDIQQHMIRFYSSFGDDVRGQRGLNMLDKYAKTMAEISMFAEGADPQALGGGVAGMIIGATPPGTPRDIGAQGARMRDIIARVLQETPTVRGEDIARDIGRLGAAQTASRMTPEQIWAVYGLAARSGGSPAVIGRGVTQLLASEIIRPQTDDQMKAFRQAGLPTDPSQLRALGGFQVLQKMMQAVAPNGARFSNPMALGVEGLDDDAAIAGSGASGINLTLASKLFGRQESFRQFLNLMAQGGIPALEKFVDGINKAKDAELGKQMAEQRNRQRAYQQLGQIQRNVGLTVARGADPALRPIAMQINRIGDWITDQNPSAVTGAVGAVGGAALASRLIFGAGIVGMLGKGAARIPGLKNIMGRFPGLATRAPQLAAASVVGSGLGAFSATGEGQTRSGSRSNPYWVVIDPLSWFMPGAPTGTGTGGGTTKPPVVPLWSRKNLATGLKATGATAALLGTPIAAQQLQDEFTRRAIASGDARRVPKGFPFLAKLGRSTRATGLSFHEGPTDDQQEVLSAFSHRYISAATAEARLKRLDRGLSARPSRGGGVHIQGEAGVTVHLVPTADLDKLLRIANKEPYLPVKLDNVQGAPRFRGQKKAQRRGPQGGR